MLVACLPAMRLPRYLDHAAAPCHAHIHKVLSKRQLALQTRIYALINLLVLCMRNHRSSCTCRTFMVRATQLLPHMRHTDTEARATPALSAAQDFALRFSLVPGGTLEITLSQFWSSLGNGDLDVSLSFHGIEARCPGRGVFLEGSHGNVRVLLR